MKLNRNYSGDDEYSICGVYKLKKNMKNNVFCLWEIRLDHQRIHENLSNSKISGKSKPTKLCPLVGFGILYIRANYSNQMAE